MDARVTETPTSQSTRGDMVERARSFQSALRETAAATETNGRVSERAMQTLNEAGLLNLLKPARFGGTQLGPSTIFAVSVELARACASVGWCAAVANTGTWMLSKWSIEAQEDVWGENPDAIVCATGAPTGKAAPVDGGYELTGQWPYASNCENSQWCILSCMVQPSGDAPAGPALFLVPAALLQVDQSSWQVSGLAGTGSKTLHAPQPIFVPAYRMVRFADIVGGTTPGEQLPDNPSAHFAFATFSASPLAGALLGMARGAQDCFAETMKAKMQPGGKTAADNPFLQQRLGWASAATDSAYALLLNDLQAAESAIFSGEQLSAGDRIRLRRDCGFGAQQARAAVDILMSVAGASSADLGKPIQRFWRDVNAGARHAALDADMVNTQMGQHIFDLPITGAY